MKDFLHWLEGKKTYIFGFLTAAAYYAFSQGWIDSTVRDVLLSTFGFATVAALRAGLSHAPAGGKDGADVR